MRDLAPIEDLRPPATRVDGKQSGDPKRAFVEIQLTKLMSG